MTTKRTRAETGDNVFKRAREAVENAADRPGDDTALSGDEYAAVHEALHAGYDCMMALQNLIPIAAGDGPDLSMQEWIDRMSAARDALRRAEGKE